MLTAELRQRLRGLNGGDTTRAQLVTESQRRRSRPLVESLGGSITANPYGNFLLWEQEVSRALPEVGALVSKLQENSPPFEDHPDPAFSTLTTTTLERVAFLDLETAGLHGRPLFMIGSLRWQDGRALLRQTFARDYSEERAVLANCQQMLAEVEVLVSFNGKSFDWPFLRDRMIYHRLPPPAPPRHLDLLHPARRRWRGKLPNCRLQTLEQHLCHRPRHGDIPGHEIPNRYHEYVRTQDPRLIAPVFHHNRLDLLMLVELLIALLGNS